MTATVGISDQAKWRNVLEQQKIANARRWLAILEASAEPSRLAQDDYDNLLRAVETTLQKKKYFEVAFKLCELLYPIAFGYADWDRWLVYLQQALHTSRELHQKVSEAILLEKIGDILYHKGNLRKAENSYFTASQIYKNSKNPSYYYRSLAMLATLKDIQGKAEEGISLCKKIILFAEDAGDNLAIAHANLNLANIYRRTRNWSEAQVTALTAYKLYSELEHSAFLTKASITLIATWAETGKWDNIDQLSNELIDVLNASGDVHNLSQLKNNLGILAFGQGNYQMAEAAWQEALQLLSQIQEPTELAGIYNNLGMVYIKLAEWETAESMLLSAVTAYRRFGDLFNWANSLDNLADLYEARGQTAEFKRTLQEAIAGLQVLKETSHANDLLDYMQKRLAKAV